MAPRTRSTGTKAPPGTGETAWALLTVSSEAQAETLAHQQQWAKETAASHGWRLTRVKDGVSTGKVGPRKIVRDLLAELRMIEPESRPRWMLMIRADRIGRGDIIDTQIVLRDLRDLGVAVWTRDQGELKLDTAMQQLIVVAQAAVAAHENDVRRDKMRALRQRKREAGEPCGTAPYGLRHEGKRLTVDSERSPIVREAFKLRLEGRGLDAIGMRLMAIAPPHVFLNGSSRIVNWTATRVNNLLSNRAYVGLIVDESTFSRAQRIAEVLTNVRLNGQSRRYPWPLAGSVRCYCGRGLSGMACGKEPWRYRYYVCKARWVPDHKTKLRLIRAEPLEKQFTELLGRLRASPELIERYRRRALAPVSPTALERSVRTLKREVAEIGRQREKVWELHASGKVRSEDVQERLDELAVRRDEVQGQLSSVQDQLAVAKAAASRERDVENLVRRAARIFAAANVREQNRVARAVSLELGGLYVDRDGSMRVGKPITTTPGVRSA